MTKAFPRFGFSPFWFHLCLSCCKGGCSCNHCIQRRSETNWTFFHLHFTYRSFGSNISGSDDAFPFIRRIWLGVSGSRSFGSSYSLVSLVIGWFFKLTLASSACHSVWISGWMVTRRGEVVKTEGIVLPESNIADFEDCYKCLVYAR